MMKMNRRQVMGGAAALSVSTGLGITGANAAAKPKVVVIGGGAGGATAARYIAKDSKGKIDVVLIEPTKRYYTCFFSNLYLGGLRKYESIGHSYNNLAAGGVTVVHDWATKIDRAAKTVHLGGGSTVKYDALVLSPGISMKYDSVPGYSVEASGTFPHAWRSGTQVMDLKRRVDAMKQGGTFVMVPPPNPFRCPPGPYERVSMIAHYFKKNNPKAKIVVLDPKDKFSKFGLFKDGWKRHYGGMVDWQPLSNLDGLKNVDVANMTFETGLEKFKADAGCVIPGMTSGHITHTAGLVDKSGWAPVHAGTMQSKKDKSVYVIGDSSIAKKMPKSGFAANSQAKSCAQAVRAALIGSKAFPAKYANTCWSLLTDTDGIKVGATYKAGKIIEKTSGFISKVGESADVRAATATEASSWYDAITKDMFGG